MRGRHRIGVVVATVVVTALVPFTQASAASKPSNSAVPKISGTPVEGATLTATTGTWSGTTPITYSFQWLRCNASSGACSAISGATGPTRVLVSADVNFKVKVTVTATNSVGSRSASSGATSKVTAVPTNAALPTVSGTAMDGSTLQAANGTWFGATPITFSYQWQRCVVGGSCSNISGATASSYVAKTADVG